MDQLSLTKLLILIAFTTNCFVAESLNAQDKKEANQNKKAGKEERAEPPKNQQEKDGPNAVVVARNRITRLRILAAKKFQIKQQLLQQIEVMKKECNLDKKQVFKLSIAAKRHASDQATAWMKKYGNNFVAMARRPAGKNEKNKDKEQEEEPVFNDADEIDQGVLSNLSDAIENPFKKRSGPTQDKAWLKLLQKELNEKQWKAFQEFYVQKMAEYQNKKLNYVLALVDLELNLTDAQMKQLRKLLEPTAKKAGRTSLVLYEPYTLLFQLYKLDQKKVAKFLTKTQLQNWKMLIAPFAELEGMMEAEDLEDDKEGDEEDGKDD